MDKTHPPSFITAHTFVAAIDKMRKLMRAASPRRLSRETGGDSGRLTDRSLPGSSRSSCSHGEGSPTPNRVNSGAINLRETAGPSPGERITLTVPPGWKPGQLLSVKVRGRTLKVAVPPTAQPGSTLQLNAEHNHKERITVTLPETARPGQMLAALAPDGRSVQFQAPADARGGMRISVALPSQGDSVFREASVCKKRQSHSGGDTSPAAPPAGHSEEPIVVDVAVPASYQEGQELQVRGSDGSQFAVAVPPGTQPGAIVRVTLPPASPATPPPPAAPPRTATLSFQVPEGHEPGSFVTIAGPNGAQFTVVIPPGAPTGASVTCEVTLPADDPPAGGDVSAGASAGVGELSIVPLQLGAAPPAARTGPLQRTTAIGRARAASGRAAAAPAAVTPLSTEWSPRDAGLARDAVSDAVVVHYETLFPEASHADGEDARGSSAADVLPAEWAGADGDVVDLNELLAGARLDDTPGERCGQGLLSGEKSGVSR